MRYVVTPHIAQENPAAPALLAEQELATAPLHLTVVGHKDDPEARALFQAAMRHPSATSGWNGGTRAKAACPTQTSSIRN
jgi:hypothetical protein